MFHLRYFELAKKLVVAILRVGVQHAFRLVRGWLLFQRMIFFSKSHALSEFGVEIRKMHLSRKINNELHGIVSYGPFKGLKLLGDSSWLPSNRGNMLLGLYEKEISELIATESKGFKYLVDVGAADGYFGLGALVANLFEHAYLFESSEKGRSILSDQAQLNGISDRVSIFGLADESFLEKIPSAQLSDSLILLDIEGGEFSILTGDNLYKLRNNILIVEMHHEFLSNGKEVLDSFRRMVDQLYEVEVIETGSRNLLHIPEIRSWSDNDRWLICSEGRPLLPTWWVLRPKK